MKFGTGFGIVTGRGVARGMTRGVGIGSGVGRAIVSGSGVGRGPGRGVGGASETFGRGFGFGAGADDGGGVYGMVVISSRALRKRRFFSSSDCGCCARTCRTVRTIKATGRADGRRTGSWIASREETASAVTRRECFFARPAYVRVKYGSENGTACQSDRRENLRPHES